MSMRKWIAGTLGLAGWIAVSSMGACGVPVESAPPSPPAAEDVGEAEEAVGVGGSCSLYQHCDPGLTCCGSLGIGTCRDLQNDHNNCGSCGHACGMYATCSQGHCCVIGTFWADGQCRTPCDTPADCPTGYACCEGVGYCANLQTDPLNCGTCTNQCTCGCNSGSCNAC